MSTFALLLGFCLLLFLGSQVSDWLEIRAKDGRKALKELARYKAFLDGLEEQAREFRLIDNFADVTVQEIATFRNAQKEINS